MMPFWLGGQMPAGVAGPPAFYTIGGTVTNLFGSGLTLQDNGGDDLAIGADGAFTFATSLVDGSHYSVTVSVNPSGYIQVCTITNGSGNLSGANVTNVIANCTFPSYSLSPTGTNPTAACYAAGSVWVSCSASNNAVKTTAGVIDNDIAVGANPSAITYDAGSNTVWTANSGDDTAAQVTLTVFTFPLSLFTVGTAPQGIASDGTYLWVSNSADNTVTKILPPTFSGAVAGNQPLGIAVDAAGNVWTANSADNTVTKISVAGAVLGTFAVGTAPNLGCYDATTNSIWTCNSRSNNVTKLDATTGATIGTYAVGTSPSDACTDGTNIWVTNSSDNTVTQITAATGAVVGTHATGLEPTAILYDGTDLWITDYSGGTVTKLDDTGALIGNYPVGTNPNAITLDGSGNLWIVDSGSDNITVLDSTGGPVGNFPIVLPKSIHFDGTYIWVGCGARPTYKIDPTSSTTLVQFAGRFLDLHSITHDTLGNIWGVDGGAIDKLHTATGIIIGTYATGSNPQGVCSDGTNIWIANGADATVTALTGATGAPIAGSPFAVGTTPAGICFDGTNVWIANSGSADVTELVAATGALVGTFPVGNGPLALCFDGTNIWVTNSADNTVTALVASTGATINTYPVDGDPDGICWDGATIWVANGARTLNSIGG